MKVRIRDIGEIYTGNTPSKKNILYWNSDDIGFVKPDIIADDAIIRINKEKCKEFISFCAIDKARIVPKNSVFVTCIGSIGKIGISKDRLAFNQQINAIVPNKNIDKEYLAYALYANKKKLQNIANAPVVPIINKTQFNDFELNIEFDTNKQYQITETLNIISTILDKMNKELELLDELVKARFVELFGDPATNEYNWPMLNLENVSSIITYGLTVRPTYVNKGIDLISARELHKGFIEYEVAPKISFNDFQSLSDKGKPLKNDILFSKTGSIGHCALVDTDKMFAITQNAARLGLIIEKVNPVWLLYYLRMNYIQDWCKRHAKGNAVKDLQLKDIKAIPLFECPLELQNQFADFVKEVDKSRFIIKSMIKEGLL